MYICVCDDEPRIAEDIAAIAEGAIEDADVRRFCSGRLLSEHLAGHEADILLLDIDMPDMSGLEIAGALGTARRKPLVVFVTAHDELVYDSLRYHPFAFVRKKYLERELPQVLRDCAGELAAKEKRFHFRSEGREITVRLAEIRYFEAEGNYLAVHLEDGECYRFRSTLGAVENTLAADGFIRIHRGFLVNQVCLKIMGQEDVQLTSGDRLPIGKLYAGSAREKILRYMRE